MFVRTDLIAEPSDNGMCYFRKVGHSIAAVLPDKTNLGVIFPQNNGLIAFIFNLELAFEESRAGRSIALAWHSDSFHQFDYEGKENVERQLSEHPETSALVCSIDGCKILESLGMAEAMKTGFLVREKNGWKAWPIIDSQRAILRHNFE